MLQFGWSRFILRILTLTVPFPSLGRGVVTCAPLTVSINVTLMFHRFFSSLASSLSIIRFLLSSPCEPLGRQSLLYGKFTLSFFCCQWLRSLVFRPGFGELFVSQHPREFCASLSPGWILVFAWNIFGGIVLFQFPVKF